MVWTWVVLGACRGKGRLFRLSFACECLLPLVGVIVPALHVLVLALVSAVVQQLIEVPKPS